MQVSSEDDTFSVDRDDPAPQEYEAVARNVAAAMFDTRLTYGAKVMLNQLWQVAVDKRWGVAPVQVTACGGWVQDTLGCTEQSYYKWRAQLRHLGYLDWHAPGGRGYLTWRLLP